jgi:malate dehydrogenase (oxaloacetate-decarboxylating)
VTAQTVNPSTGGDTDTGAGDGTDIDGDTGSDNGTGIGTTAAVGSGTTLAAGSGSLAAGVPADADPVFGLHRGGKMEIAATVPVRGADDLSLAYTPGVARVCTAIAERPELAHDYTWTSQVVAVVTDGTAVLGLGDIGPRASLPVMEGKAILFKQFGGVDAVPIALDCTDVDEIVDTVVRLAPSFGGVNLEDIAAPRCFEIERRLKEALDIPVFHDDQHGTAVVTLAALRNACALTGRPLSGLRAVISGAGAAGVAIARILVGAGIGDVAVTDRRGVVHSGREDLTPVKRDLASFTNTAGLTGSLADALAGADVFIGVSGGTVPEAAVASMAEGCFVFAMANPTPEVHPEVAHRYAAVVATGRSDFPNQINNVLAFPGIFAGALRVRASAITEGMKIAAADALAAVVADELSATCVIPSPFDPRVAPAVTAAVAAAARAEGVARR